MEYTTTIINTPVGRSQQDKKEIRHKKNEIHVLLCINEVLVQGNCSPTIVVNLHHQLTEGNRSPTRCDGDWDFELNIDGGKGDDDCIYRSNSSTKDFPPVQNPTRWTIKTFSPWLGFVSCWCQQSISPWLFCSHLVFLLKEFWNINESCDFDLMIDVAYVNSNNYPYSYTLFPFFNTRNQFIMFGLVIIVFDWVTEHCVFVAHDFPHRSWFFFRFKANVLFRYSKNGKSLNHVYMFFNIYLFHSSWFIDLSICIISYSKHG